MIVARSESCTEDSEDEIDEIDVYRRKYQLLLDRCEVLQQDNERIVNRIQKVKKLLRITRKERRFLMNRLDQYGDNWRTASLSLELDEPIDPPAKGLSNERAVNIAKLAKQASSVATPEKTAAVSAALLKKTAASSAPTVTTATQSPAPKKKGTKVASDPNAPKRPANPFFQFCQEQRPVLLEQILSSGQKEPTKQELTKQLATKWNSLTTDDKKIYYDMYEKSKEKYTADMHLYSINKGKTS